MSRKVFVAGVGMTSFTKPGAGPAYDVLGAEAARKALVDAGVAYTQVQQVRKTARSNSFCGRVVLPISLASVSLTWPPWSSIAAHEPLAMSHLDDFRIDVGYALPHLVLPPVDRTVLALFAGASGDHHPLHIDVDYARRAGMPDVFAHGMLVMAWLGRLITQWTPQRRLRELNARFLGMTHLGHIITCSGKVIERLERGGETLLRIEVRSTNQYGETKILGDALVAAQPASAEAAI